MGALTMTPPPPKAATGETRRGHLTTRQEVDTVVTTTFRALERQLDESESRRYAHRMEVDARLDGTDRALADIQARLAVLESSPWCRVRAWWLGLLRSARGAWL
jgi:hypothetical protein